MTNQQFIDLISNSVCYENKKRGNPIFSSVVIAQAILETGWGKCSLMMKANAVFGIKATSDWKGKVFNSITQECYDGSTFTNINACFRAYNSIQESVSDYFNLICKSERYRKATVTNSPLECITEIKNGGYATDPEYINKIMNIINSWNLTKFDNEIHNDIEMYEVGKNYTLQENVFVRTGVGTINLPKKYEELTEDGKKHALHTNDGQIAVLKKGTVVTCLEVRKENNNIWLKIPSGFVCALFNGEVLIK